MSEPEFQTFSIVRRGPSVGFGLTSRVAVIVGCQVVARCFVELPTEDTTRCDDPVNRPPLDPAGQPPDPNDAAY
jgi:hypothetical protein